MASPEVPFLSPLKNATERRLRLEIKISVPVFMCELFYRSFMCTQAVVLTATLSLDGEEIQTSIQTIPFSCLLVSVGKGPLGVGKFSLCVKSLAF